MVGSASRPITSVSAVGDGNGAPVSVGDGETVGRPAAAALRPPRNFLSRSPCSRAPGRRRPLGPRSPPYEPAARVAHRLCAPVAGGDRSVGRARSVLRRIAGGALEAPVRPRVGRMRVAVSAVGDGSGAPVSVGDAATVGGLVRGTGVGLGAELVSSLHPLSPSAATIVTAPRTAAIVRCTQSISRLPRATTWRTPWRSASRWGWGQPRTGRSEWRLSQEQTLR